MNQFAVTMVDNGQTKLISVLATSKDEATRLAKEAYPTATVTQWKTYGATRDAQEFQFKKK